MASRVMDVLECMATNGRAIYSHFDSRHCDANIFSDTTQQTTRGQGEREGATLGCSSIGRHVRCELCSSGPKLQICLDHPTRMDYMDGGGAIFIIAYILYAEVMRENAYLSRTIEIQQGQQVIDTGLYSIVRHPMYSATILIFLSMPLILGSIISFGIMLVYIPIIVIRIKNEERVLDSGLKGYMEYKKRVKHRIIPLIW